MNKPITTKSLEKLLAKHRAILWLHGQMAGGKTHTAQKLFPNALTLVSHHTTAVGLKNALIRRAGCIVFETAGGIGPEHSDIACAWFNNALPVSFNSTPKSPKKFSATQLILITEGAPTDAMLASRCFVVRCVRKKAGRGWRFSLRLESKPRTA